MKVFLVDDEHYIIELLKRIIDWESIDMEIVGYANNGQSAMNGIMELRPDIIITDIRMPDFDGLEIIRKVAGEGIKTNFILISGYRNFEYAQTAMKYGVKEFILKPIQSNELRESLLRVSNDINRNEMEIAEITNVAFEYKQKMRRLLISSIMNSYIEPSSDLNCLNNEYCTYFQQGSFLFVTMRVDNLSETSAASIFDHHEGIDAKALGELCHDTISHYDGGNQWLLLNYDRAHEERINIVLRRSFKNSVQTLGNYSDLRVSVAVGDAVECFSSVAASFDTCCEALRNRILSSSGLLVYQQAADDQNHMLEEIFPESEQKAFARNVASASFENVKMQICKVFINLKSKNLVSASPYWRVSILFFESFWAEMDHVFLKGKRLTIDKFKNLLFECATVEKMQRACIDSTITCFSDMFDGDDFSGNVVIAIVKRYIHDNYHERITLEDISRIVYLNPYYLSARFKRETGMPISMYLNNYRISKAKEFLKQLDKSISEVGIQVGIPDPRYFTRAFKKNVGLSPKEFRKKFAVIEAPVPRKPEEK